MFLMSSNVNDLIPKYTWVKKLFYGSQNNVKYLIINPLMVWLNPGIKLGSISKNDELHISPGTSPKY